LRAQQKLLKKCGLKRLDHNTSVIDQLDKENPEEISSEFLAKAGSFFELPQLSDS